MSWICGHLARCLSCYGCRMAGLCGSAPKAISTHQPADAASGGYEVPPAEYADGVSVLSYNVQMLLFHADTRRARSIAERVLHEDAHVVCLQEAFDEDARRALVRGLRKRYPFYVSRAGYKGACGLGEDSGLMVFSRFPIERARFSLFTSCRCCLSDSMAAKGFVRVDLSVGGETVRLFNSHLYADAMGVEDRVDQLNDLVYEMDSTPERVRHVIFCGDLNVAGESPEYYETLRSDELGTAAWRDVFRSLHPVATEEPGFTCEPLTPEEMETVPYERLDYMFDVFSTLVWLGAEVRRMDCLSDHFALLTRFRLPGPLDAPPGGDAPLLDLPGPEAFASEPGSPRLSVVGVASEVTPAAAAAGRAAPLSPPARVTTGQLELVRQRSAPSGSRSFTRASERMVCAADPEVPGGQVWRPAPVRPVLRPVFVGGRLAPLERRNLGRARLRRVNSQRPAARLHESTRSPSPGAVSASSDRSSGAPSRAASAVPSEVPSDVSYDAEMARPSNTVRRAFRDSVARQSNAYSLRYNLDLPGAGAGVGAVSASQQRRRRLHTAMQRAAVRRRKLAERRDGGRLTGCCIVRQHTRTRNQPTDIDISVTRLSATFDDGSRPAALPTVAASPEPAESEDSAEPVEPVRSGSGQGLGSGGGGGGDGDGDGDGDDDGRVVLFEL